MRNIPTVGVIAKAVMMLKSSGVILMPTDMTKCSLVICLDVS